MNVNKIRSIGCGLLVAVYLGLTLCNWFLPAGDISEAERRPLAQMPDITWQSILDGKFMPKFDEYSLDQFPARDTFRKIKSLYHYYVMGQKDNNGIYIADGYAAQQEYPLKESSVSYAMSRFQRIYEKYLKDTGSAVHFVAVPDKGYYLAEPNGHLAMDYDKMFALIQSQLPFANFIDVTGDLNAQSYYFTDTHWRQEMLLDAANTICKEMGVTGPKAEDFTKTEISRPFYGVYYGQAALPMEPETMYIMESDLLRDCTVYNHETGKNVPIYDMEMLEGMDLYNIYLSGPRSILTITNPNAKTDKELIVFRDSFGSSMVPLLLQDYASVTLLDIRYLPSSEILGNFVDFHGQDVLMLYSTLVLNNAETMK